MRRPQAGEVGWLRVAVDDQEVKALTLQDLGQPGAPPAGRQGAVRVAGEEVEPPVDVAAELGVVGRAPGSGAAEEGLQAVLRISRREAVERGLELGRALHQETDLHR